MRRDVRQHASALVWHECDTRDGGRDARCEPRREVRQRLDPDVRRVACLERIENGANDSIVPRGGGVAQHTQLVAERAAHRRIDGVVDSTQG
jgi:hypothetical protein